jgi:hypothetical protein
MRSHGGPGLLVLGLLAGLDVTIAAPISRSGRSVTGRFLAALKTLGVGAND